MVMMSLLSTKKPKDRQSHCAYCSGLRNFFLPNFLKITPPSKQEKKAAEKGTFAILVIMSTDTTLKPTKMS